MLTIVRNYINTKSPISHKYLNHGKRVPFQKCFKFNFYFNNQGGASSSSYIRTYSTNSSTINNVILYEDAFSHLPASLSEKTNSKR